MICYYKMNAPPNHQNSFIDRTIVQFKCVRFNDTLQNISLTLVNIFFPFHLFESFCFYFGYIWTVASHSKFYDVTFTSKK